MVKSNNTQVTISAAMLDCLKQVLFSQTNGVDLSPIIEDLGGDDKTAIAVALAYKGIKPEIDDALRFDYYGDYYNHYKFISYSIIKDAVTATCYTHTLNKTTGQWTMTKQQRNCFIPLSHWLDMSTSEQECRNKVRDYLNPVGKESKTVLRTSPKD